MAYGAVDFLTLIGYSVLMIKRIAVILLTIYTAVGAYGYLRPHFEPAVALPLMFIAGVAFYIGFSRLVKEL